MTAMMYKDNDDMSTQQLTVAYHKAVDSRNQVIARQPEYDFERIAH